MSQDDRQRQEHPETALEEVTEEVAEAGRRVRETPAERRRRGEAGEAVTPNQEAQEQSRGD
ncbi:hypothetical protein ACWEGS_26850 [Streptomyces sp. NPDC004822]